MHLSMQVQVERATRGMILPVVLILCIYIYTCFCHECDHTSIHTTSGLSRPLRYSKAQLRWYWCNLKSRSKSMTNSWNFEPFGLSLFGKPCLLFCQTFPSWCVAWRHMFHGCRFFPDAPKSALEIWAFSQISWYLNMCSFNVFDLFFVF